MVSVLTKIFGLKNIEVAEDIVQDTLLKALESWKLSGIPENPSAWLMAAAKNKTIDFLRREKRHAKYTAEVSPLLKSEYTLGYTIKNYFSDNEIKDDQLRMMFVCCHPDLNEESQIALILKTLCGFSVHEIAKAFLSSDETISKRLYRSKEKFRNGDIRFELPPQQETGKRLDSVLKTLYLLFNEGYNSTHSEKLIREDLVEEAIRLCAMLSDHTTGDQPQTFALLALMYFHAARLSSRLNDDGDILLLKDQDRTRWKKEFIRAGIQYLEKASTGNTISTYHFEAAIAYEHCTAETYERTNWKNILHYYDGLLAITSSPVTALNRAIALCEIAGHDAALEEMFGIEKTGSLKGYYLLPAAIGDMLLRKNEMEKARAYFEKALLLTASPHEKKLLELKIQLCRS